MHKTSKAIHKTHTPYADISVLQTLCIDSALRLELKNGTCNQGRTNFACSIVSWDTCPCLLLTNITRDFTQKWIFYRQFWIGYSFTNCTVWVSFFVEPKLWWFTLPATQCMYSLKLELTIPDRRQSWTVARVEKRGLKAFKIVFSIANYRFRLPICNLKRCFNAKSIHITRVSRQFTTAAYPECWQFIKYLLQRCGNGNV